ncbi:Dehydrogenases with different specificities (related to short-chain alcohol dehydrogenases) [Handroanthus impetiginosus]|uniref:Dehydrogenases with different specificities (Related to short-chain alcohol dehydrogenases) n=1 Tax=Handroanthus impetiginosus TaxID=429701 RepID=A0A2G9I5N3_9LAMI|nr:Dehydrogenases with different specificities (related to short-chain alcohol dehydrogenases) [Handroanthus impetiginosus]
MWVFSRKGPLSFSATSTAEQVTEGIDGSGVTAIVTGASSGIGAETARVLALRGVHVVMAVRNLSAGNDAKKAIIKEIPNAKVDAMELDLSSMASIRKFASKFNSLGLPLNVLVNNAGVMATPFMLSKHNIELQFATNHVDKYSFGETNEAQINIHLVKLMKNRYNGLSAYGQSKLANVLHANELARRLKEEKEDITANSLHPGAIATNLFRHHRFINGNILHTLKNQSFSAKSSNKEREREHNNGCGKRTCIFPPPVFHQELAVRCIYFVFCDVFISRFKSTNPLLVLLANSGLVDAVGNLVMKNVHQVLYFFGAATTCYVALHPDVKGMTGKYYADSNLAETSLQAKDEELAKKLWDFTQNLIDQMQSLV